VLSAQIRNRRPSLRLLQHRQYLAVRKPRSLHVELPPMKKFYFSNPHLGGGITIRPHSALDGHTPDQVYFANINPAAIAA
jgi:hypothetical protein